jgi:hypothetical protein|tara:strand:- start:184 stop:378 length:195 start_codon:yes stop_codon:yes gene_type:complete
MKKDFLGNELNIGDPIVFVQLGYRCLQKGVVERLTDKMVFIKHKKFNTGGETTKQEHNQVIKIR